MIINRTGESYTCEEGTFTIGEKIYANNNSEWEGLFGIITEIRTDGDKETGNDTPDIYCSFQPPVIPEDIRELEERFSDLYGGPKTMEDISLDLAIMAPEMIDRLVPWEQMQPEKIYMPVYPDIDGCFTSMADVRRRLSECESPEHAGVPGVSEYPLYVDPGFRRKMYEAYRDERLREDMAGQMGQDPDLTGLSRETVRKILAEPHLADRFEDILGKNNAYWEIYWDSVDSLIRELVEKVSHEGEGEETA